jgi:arsenical pump membrane protein
MYEKIAVEFIFIISCIVMIFLIVRRSYLYIRLGSRKIRLDTYFLGALLGPILILIFGFLNYSQIIRSFSGEGSLNPFGILVLFLSMVFMSIYLDITGFFEYCARVALRFSGDNGKKLFFSFYFIISALTIFTSNDIIILTFTPFIYYFSKHAGLDPLPFLIAEFFAANTWSMMLYIGNPTNIVLAAAFKLDFVEYFKWMIAPTLVAGFVNIALLYLIFRKKINKPIKIDHKINPIDALSDKTGAVLGLVILSGCIVGLAIAPYFDINMWIVSITFAAALIIILFIRDFYVRVFRKIIDKKTLSISKTAKRMPLGIIPFVLGMFITVEALRLYGVSEEIGLYLKNITGQSAFLSSYIYGFTSAFSANIFNNIPMTVFYVPILQVASSSTMLPGILATTIGSNLGANITPIGALAGLMWMVILRDKDVKISFREFVKYGLIITPITLILCLGVLALEFTFL